MGNQGGNEKRLKFKRGGNMKFIVPAKFDYKFQKSINDTDEGYLWESILKNSQTFGTCLFISARETNKIIIIKVH